MAKITFGINAPNGVWHEKQQITLLKNKMHLELQATLAQGELSLEATNPRLEPDGQQPGKYKLRFE